MNKNDLIASVASSAGLSKSDSTRALESLLDSITTYFSPAAQPVQPVLEELTAGKLMIDNGKTPEQVLADPFLIHEPLPSAINGHYSLANSLSNSNP